MQPMQRRTLAERIAEAAEAALAEQQHVSPVDVFLGIGWTDGGSVKRWQAGQIDCFEALLQTKPARIDEALVLLRRWAVARGLTPREASYPARTPDRRQLRFSRGGDRAAEARYRTQWISAALPETQRQRLAEKTDRAPELVVVMPLKPDWACHRCGGTGNLLIMENPGPACLRCAGLDGLEFLPAGDALLTRRAKAKSGRSAVVVRFARARKRYERQGLLVEPDAVAEARRETASR